MRRCWCSWAAGMTPTAFYRGAARGLRYGAAAGATAAGRTVRGAAGALGRIAVHWPRVQSIPRAFNISGCIQCVLADILASRQSSGYSSLAAMRSLKTGATGAVGGWF